MMNMMTETRESATDLLVKLEQFARNEFPPLLPKIHATRAAILKAYIRAGKPNGDGVQAADAWFNQLYAAWQLVQENTQLQELAAMQQTAESQLLQMGDLERRGNTIMGSPKGLARTVILMLSMAVEAADRDMRGLEEADESMIEYVLMKVLAELRGRKAA